MKALKWLFLLAMSFIFAACTPSPEEMQVLNHVPTRPSKCKVGMVLKTTTSVDKNSCFLKDDDGNEILVGLPNANPLLKGYPMWAFVSFDEAIIARVDLTDEYLFLSHPGHIGTLRVTMTSTIIDGHYEITTIDMADDYVVTDMDCLESYLDLGGSTTSIIGDYVSGPAFAVADSQVLLQKSGSELQMIVVSEPAADAVESTSVVIAQGILPVNHNTYSTMVGVYGDKAITSVMGKCGGNIYPVIFTAHN